MSGCGLPELEAAAGRAGVKEKFSTAKAQESDQLFLPPGTESTWSHVNNFLPRDKGELWEGHPAPVGAKGRLK